MFERRSRRRPGVGVLHFVGGRLILEGINKGVESIESITQFEDGGIVINGFLKELVGELGLRSHR